MIDRDSYSPGSRGYDEFVADACALLDMVRSYSARDVMLDRAVASADMQRLVDSTRRAVAATAVDELATLADLMADVALEFDAPIEEDLRAAKRLLDVIYAMTNHNRAPLRKTTLFDPPELPEFKSWRHDSNN